RQREVFAWFERFQNGIGLGVSVGPVLLTQPPEGLFQYALGPTPLEQPFGTEVIGEFPAVAPFRSLLIEGNEDLSATTFARAGPIKLVCDEMVERQQEK